VILFTFDSCDSQRIDHRNRRDRVEIQTAHWSLQMANLVNAYLDCRHRDAGDGMPKISSQLGTATCPPVIVEVLDIFCE
jgi:hypothetical protein